MSNNSRGILYAAITASLWGFLAIALKIAVQDLSPVTVVWFRFATAFIILALATLIFSKKDFSIFRKPPLLLFAAGIFLGLNYLGFISGIGHVSPASAQVFIQIGPVSFALSGILIFREKVNWKHLVGFILVICGILLFYSEQLSMSGSGGRDFTLGMIMILSGGVSWAVFASLQKKLVRTYNTNQLNLFIYGLCAVLLLPFASFGNFPHLQINDWLLLFYLGLNTVLAYGSLALAIKLTEANRVSVIITLNPILTFVTMVILAKMKVPWIEPEQFTFYSIAGALTVLTGAIVVILAGRKRRS